MDLNKITTRMRDRGAFLGVSLMVLLIFSLVFYQASAMIQAPESEPNDAVIQILIDESYVNQVINEELEEDPNYSDPIIDLRAPNVALVTVTVHLPNGLSLRPTASLNFEVINHKVEVEVTAITVSGFLIPQQLVRSQIDVLTEEIEAEISAFAEAMQVETGLVITDVSASDTELIIDLGEESILTPTPTPTP